MRVKQFIKPLVPPVLWDVVKYAVDPKSANSDKAALEIFESNGRIPWTAGYAVYREQLVCRTLEDLGLMELFRSGAPLPPRFGFGADERCIEYPWVMARLADISGRILDAGSALNHDYILEQRPFERNKLHILTLAPEGACFWRKGISYIYDDLREIPCRDNYYDAVVCLSTLEHVGCDNRIFSHADADNEKNLDDFVLVMREFRRVLKSGGRLLLTVPFGAYGYFGTFQQFDRDALSHALDAFGAAAGTTESFYRYSVEGWQLALDIECADCHYVGWLADAWHHGQFPNPVPAEPDLAAAARAVACVELIKP
jgi:SAM-dependent methyltransferase